MKPEQYQCLLAALGYYGLRRADGSLAIDGIPGRATERAILAFQRDHPQGPGGEVLGADGAWGPQTEKAVRQAIGAGESPEKGQVTARQIWEFFRSRGLSPGGTAGILGNLNAESGLEPGNLEDRYEGRLGMDDRSYTRAVDAGSYGGFARDCAGYGLAQWTWHSRKQALLTEARRAGRSVGDPEIQLEFLLKELKLQYPGLLKLLQGPVTPERAAEAFMRTYEQPEDQGPGAVGVRGAMARRYYREMMQ